MPPKFSKAHLIFPEGTPVPVHVDGWPIRDEIDTDAYRLEEMDGLDGGIHVVAADIESLEQAILLRLARTAFTHERTVINRGLPVQTYSPTAHIPVNWREFPELRS